MDVTSLYADRIIADFASINYFKIAKNKHSTVVPLRKIGITLRQFPPVVPSQKTWDRHHFKSHERAQTL